ncbi:MAG TPA: hypothetical protein PLN21_02585 [Gemmatales bacterium]|nr:hypothetical protein [Gemmatales bacterium]
MAEATLIACNGARRVARDDLVRVSPPPPSRTHFPIPHKDVVSVCEGTLRDAGYGIKSAEYALSQEGQQLFCTYTLTTEVANGIGVLAVGLRSSYNKTLPLGLVGGSKVFVCSNLSFRADLINVRRLHTKFAQKRFAEDIVGAIEKLPSFKETETRRIGILETTCLSDDQADALILRAAIDKQIIATRNLPKVVHEWREPTHEQFRPRTAWSLFNAVTTVLGVNQDRNPNNHALRTMRLNKLLLPNDQAIALAV